MVLRKTHHVLLEVGTEFIYVVQLSFDFLRPSHGSGRHSPSSNRGDPNSILPRTVAEQSKVRVCGRLLAGVTGSTPAGGMDNCVVCCK